jgi:LPXTG-motif cell wall-anchored protein
MKKNRIFFVLALACIVMLRLVAATDNYNVEVSDVSPTSLVPGEQAELEFQVENTGNMDLDNLVFSWEENTGSILPVGSSNTQSIDSLGDGDDETFSFEVFTSASADPGLYELVLTIRFTNESGTTVTETSNVGIIVGGQTDFDVSVTDVSSSGVILSVANIGKNPAESVTVIIPDQSNFEISGSSSSIIGNLNKGDYSVASFQISSLAKSSSNLKVEIQYTDTTGTRQTLNKTVEVQSTSTTKLTTSASSTTTATGYSVNNTGGSSNTWLIIGFATSVVLTIGVIIFIVKRNRKKNETN